MRKPSWSVCHSVAAATVSVCMPFVVCAQRADTNQDEQAASMVAEVIVTANRREEDVLDVPLSISAISGEDIRNRLINSAYDVQYAVPNVNVTSAYGQSRVDISIRGVTAITANQFSDVAPIGVYSDEIFMNSRESQVSQMYDLERIEVLRGPQGTLFGRNTTGGALSYYSKLPSTQGGSSFMQVGIGNLGQYSVESGVNIPLGEMWAARVAAKHQSTDGYVTNVVNGDKYFGRESTGGRVLLRRESDGSDIVFNVHAGTSEGGTGVYHPIGSGLDFYQTATTCPDCGDEQDTAGASVKATFFFDSFDLVSITGYETVESYTRESFQWNLIGPLNGFYSINLADGTGEQWQASQELRLVSRGNERMDWVVGLFAFREELDAMHDAGLGIVRLAGVPYSDKRIYTQETVSYAAFGQMTYRLTDSFSLTGGLRYTNDSKDLVYEFSSTRLPSWGPVARDESWDDVSGRLGFEYRYSPDSMLYASYNRGFKGGMYNTGTSNPNALNVVDPEIANAYELGWKSKLGSRAQLSVAAFYTGAKDVHVTQITASPFGLVPLYQNAAEVETKGVEFELDVRPLDEMTIRFTGGYLDARFLKYIDLTPAGGTIDYSGNPLNAASKWSGMLLVSYDWNLAGGATLTPNVTVGYKSRQNTRQYDDPLDELPARTLVDAQIRYQSPGGNYSISLWSKNLLDEEYAFKRYNNPGFLGLPGNILQPAPPRTYGLAFQYNW